MSYSAQYLNASEAAERLGVSIKALRLYEERSLLTPIRTAAGWRTYGPSEMKRASEIAALRKLGLSLAQVDRVLRGEPENLISALAAHQAGLEMQMKELARTTDCVRAFRAALARGQAPTAGELSRLVYRETEPVAFGLPWPWGGERFELRNIAPLTYITGPLGSGKTRLARAIAENLPDASFIGLERLPGGEAEAAARMDGDPALKARVDQMLNWLAEDGAVASPALTVLLVAMEAAGSSTFVVDLIEQGLDHATQEALIAYLRHNRTSTKPLFLMTRSCVILDLNEIGPDEAIIFCPANHSPPIRVAPYPGAPGYEAVITCLATPEVRARTDGVIAWRPPVAAIHS